MFLPSVDPAGRVLLAFAETIYRDERAETGSSHAVRSPLGGWGSEQVIDTGGYVSEAFAEPTGAVSWAKKAGRVKLRAGKRGRVRVRFGATARRAARDALAADRKPWVAFTVRAKGRSPRTVAFSRRVMLRP